jgi:hypothetical protein
MDKARDQRKMIYFRHPLTEGPSAQDARQATDHHGPGQAEFRFPGFTRCFTRCSSPIYGSKNDAKRSAKK